MAEKKLIDADALTEVIECTDWYHVSLQGNLVHGARSDIHTPLYKADDIYKALKDSPTVEAVPVSELLELRDWLYENDSIFMDGLWRLNDLISRHKEGGGIGNG